MRVVFLSAARQVWGAEVSLLTLAQALSAGGVRTAVVCPPGELARRAPGAGVSQVRPAGVSAEGELGRVREAWQLWSTYAKDAKAGDRLVVFSYYLLGLAPVFAPLLRRRGVRIGLDFHDTLTSRKARWAVGAGSLACDRVIACSAFTAGQLAHHPGVAHLHRPVVERTTPTRSAAPIGAGVDALPTGAPVAVASLERDRRGTEAEPVGGAVATHAPPRAPHSTPRPRPGDPGEVATCSERDRRPGGGRAPAAEARREPGRFRVGIIGRISPEKRHELLIDAVDRLGGDADLVVRGGDDGWAGDYPTRLLRAGHDRLGQRFRMEGRVAPERAMAELDVVVVGNPAEPMGRTVLEAADRGVVAVVPDSGGASELVEEGVSGFVYRHDDPADLARVLDRVRREPALVSDMVSVAQSRIPRPAQYARDYLRLLG
ncbi:glycosyltransferase family 4 protein [Agilicoccus flavus]|uniref:glycosyltransferase family 4 protein n=1 Tax=Agilicoccus flavus TaxID=2775968 RepID=UPI001CF63C35|nr:glycosyltransferase family 4 protein [Agilicoccus flavus]